MKKSFFFTALLIASLVPSTFAFGAISYGEERIREVAIPDEMGVMKSGLKYSDPSLLEEGPLSSCRVLYCKTFSSPGWIVSLFEPNDQYFTQYDKEFGDAKKSIKNHYTNFQALLAGTKKLSDFFTADGLPIDGVQGPFDIEPRWGMEKILFADDIQVIVSGGVTIGYSFTPLLQSQDYPPTFFVRRSIVFSKEKNLYIVADYNLNTGIEAMGGDDRMYMLFHEKGKKDASGNVDWNFYTIPEIAKLLKENDFLQTKIVPINSDYTNTTKIVAQLVAGIPQQVFSDVRIGSKLDDAISYVKFNKFVDGYPDGTYKPDNKINRAEFVKILVAATYTGDISKYASESCFNDVVAQSWYTPYVCYAKAKGIIAGYADGTFGVSKNVNLAEALKIVMNAYNLKIEPDASSWYAPYFATLQSNYIDLRFDAKNPSMNISRAEMAELIMNIDLVKDNPFATNE